MAVNHKVVGSSPAGTVFIASVRYLSMSSPRHTLASSSAIGYDASVVLRYTYYGKTRCSKAEARGRRHPGTRVAVTKGMGLGILTKLRCYVVSQYNSDMYW